MDHSSTSPSDVEGSDVSEEEFVDVEDEENKEIVDGCGLPEKNNDSQSSNDASDESLVPVSSHDTSLSSSSTSLESQVEEGNHYAYSVKYEYEYEYELLENRYRASCPCEKCDPDEKLGWSCSVCNNPLATSSDDDRLRCLCGSGKLEDFRFRCDRPSHGSAGWCQRRKPRPMTILILGETGVGKSTFINGFANYLRFPTLEEARREKGSLLSPVKSSFIMTNENFDQTAVTTGSEDNECQIIGHSATQGTKAHVFFYNGLEVRLIDTPGIGDTRGIEYDKENFQNILSYISNYDEIHGICILLKPNNSRLTITFEFCVKELLIHLHRNAGKNIFFCFTNARNTNYRPGDTYPALQQLLRQNEGLPITLGKENVFCMDNESFRYLAAVKQGIQFGEEDDRMYGVSWERARRETDRLLSYVSRLKGHKVKDTITINDVRRKIVDLTKPLAEIVRLINVTIAILKDHKIEVEQSEKSAQEIQKSIKIIVPSLARQSLDHPRTVCTSLTCSQVHVVNGQDVKKFTINCHEICSLKGVQADSINNPDLKHCWALYESKGDACRVCNCNWNHHMHVTYEMVPVMNPGEDIAAKLRYRGITDRIKLKEKLVADCETTIGELQWEKDSILRASAQFGAFLRENSVIPYNDAMTGYLNYILKMEREKAAQSEDYSRVQTLLQIKARYEEEVQIIKNASSAVGFNLEQISAKNQHLVLEGLFAMKHFGQNLRNMLTELEQENSKRVAFKENKYEVSPIPPTPEETKEDFCEQEGAFQRFVGMVSSTLQRMSFPLHSLFGRHPAVKFESPQPQQNRMQPKSPFLASVFGQSCKNKKAFHQDQVKKQPSGGSKQAKVPPSFTQLREKQSQMAEATVATKPKETQTLSAFQKRKNYGNGGVRVGTRTKSGAQ